MKTIVKLVCAAFPIIANAQLPALQELRYCGPPARTAEGQIVRRVDVRTAFRKIHPCPSTGMTTGACGGWQIDHVIPLACGGCDAVTNMQWLPLALKTAPRVGKDRFERTIYERDVPCR